MTTPLTQLLLRTTNQWSGGRALWVNPPDASLLQAPGVQFPDAIWCTDYRSYMACRDSAGDNCEVRFCHEWPGSGAYDQILLFQPREKRLLEYYLRVLGNLLGANGQLWLMGENQAGAKSAGGRLKTFFAEVDKADSARRCSLFRARKLLRPLGASLEELAQPLAGSEAWAGTELLSYPGVFSHGELDPASALLLETFLSHPLPSGGLLDFGCGCGVLGLTALHGGHSGTVDLLDSNAFALAASERNAQAMDVSVGLLPSDGFSALQGEPGRYRSICSNPPFHRGVQTRYDTAIGLLNQAPAYLQPGGELRLVANTHLPYRAPLEQSFGRVEELARTTRFVVYRAIKRNPP